MHLTETCEEDLPNLITNVITTADPVADADVTQVVYEALQAKGLLCSILIVDSGYIDVKLLLSIIKLSTVNNKVIGL